MISNKLTRSLQQKAVDLAELLRIFEYYQLTFIKHSKEVPEKRRYRRGLQYAGIRVKACARKLGVPDDEMDRILFSGDLLHKDLAGEIFHKLPDNMGKIFLSAYLILFLLEIRCYEDFSPPIDYKNPSLNKSLSELKDLCKDLGLYQEYRALYLALTHYDFSTQDAQIAGNTLLLQLATNISKQDKC